MCSKKITRENILDYYNRRYVPENMTVVFAGNLDINETKALIEKHFNTERRFFQEVQLTEPDYSRGSFATKRDYDIENKKIYLAYYLDYDSPKQRAVTDILSYMLNGNSEMILDRELWDKSKIANSIDIYIENMSKLRSVFTVYMETDSSGERTALKTDSILKMIGNSEKFKKDFNKAKSALIADEKFKTINSFNAVGMIYEGYIKFSDPKYFLKTSDLLERVEYKDVQTLAKEFFEKPMSLVAEKFSDETYPERKNFKIINFQDETLANGNIVRFYETSNIDYSLIFVSFPFGYKDGVRLGSTAFIQGMLNDKMEKSDFIKKTHSRHYVMVNENNTIIGLKVLSENSRNAIEYISKLLKDVSFNDDMFEKHKATLKNTAKNRKEDPADVASDDFQRLFVQNGEYTIFPSEKDIESVTLEDMKRDIQNMLSGNQKVYIWGNVDKEYARTFAKNLYRENQLFTRKTDGYREFSRDSNNTENNQSNIYIAYFTDEKFTEKELYALTMFASFFRGSKSFIHEALRGENDLVYYGYGYLAEKDMVPAFIMNAQTSEEKTEEAIKVMEEVFNKISSGDFKDDEITKRKNEQLLKVRFEFNNPEWTLMGDISGSYSPFKDKKYYLNEKIGWVTKDDMLSAVKKLTKFKSTLIYK
ncbi:MAG: M16 family metallopeptidase [bacterium]